MSKPDQAAHLMGKLLKYLGEDRICWGTDSLCYGIPQDQIQAFRTFEISTEFQGRYGYPPLSAETKRKIFGLSAARIHGIHPETFQRRNTSDRLSTLRREYTDRSNPSFVTYGPKTWKGFKRGIRSKGIFLV